MASRLSRRNPVYLASRLRAVFGRYGLGSRRAKERVRRCVRTLASHGFQPTFATPGRVVERDPGFFRELRDAGVELAVHGYDHADFRRLTTRQAAWQIERALAAYSRNGIPCEGFRCPYLSCTPEVRSILPDGAFEYSSNRAVASGAIRVDAAGPVFAQLARNYRAASSHEVVCTPAIEDGLVELPASVPDDLQLCDGLGLGPDGMADAWVAMLRESHERGELFVPLFHPEAYDLLEGAVDGLLEAAARAHPPVWLTQLRHVARWWRARRGFGVAAQADEGGMRVRLDCDDAATVMVRAWPWPAATRPWDGAWAVLDDRTVRIEDSTRPFVGVTGVERATVDFLREQGYVVEEGGAAERCSVRLTGRAVAELGSRRALLAHVEASPGPLLKYSRWPSEAKSAFCLAGDLDALSLRDYAERLTPAVRARSGLRSRRVLSAGAA
jgi:hypothetical protein